MIAYRDKYTQPVTYSAVNQMAKISQLAAQLIAADPEQEHKTILSSKEMVELYCRKNPGDVDDDEADKIDVNDIEGTLASNLTDYVPIQRNRHAGTCGYYNSLLRIETLQFYDVSLPVIVDDKQTIEYTEWTPKRCEKDTEQCNIVLHGIFTRFCYDTDEPFLLEVKRYKCTTHYNIKNGKRSPITFNMLNECVEKQMSELQTIRKTQDVMVFDSVLINANLCMYYYMYD